MNNLNYNPEYLKTNKTKILIILDEYYKEKLLLDKVNPVIHFYWDELKKAIPDPFIEELGFNQYELNILKLISQFKLEENIIKYFNNIELNLFFKSPLRKDLKWINPINIQVDETQLGEYKYFIKFIIKNIYKKNNADFLAILDFWSEKNYKNNLFQNFLNFNECSEEQLQSFIDEFNKCFQRISLINFSSNVILKAEPYWNGKNIQYQIKIENNLDGILFKDGNNMTHILATPSHNTAQIELNSAINISKFFKQLGIKFDMKLYFNTPLKTLDNQIYISDFESINIVYLIQFLNKINDEDLQKTIDYLNDNILTVQTFGSNYSDCWNYSQDKLNLAEEKLEDCISMLRKRNKHWLRSHVNFRKNMLVKMGFAIHNLQRCIEKLNYKNNHYHLIKNFKPNIYKIKNLKPSEKIIINNLKNNIKLIPKLIPLASTNHN